VEKSWWAMKAFAKGTALTGRGARIVRHGTHAFD